MIKPKQLSDAVHDLFYWQYKYDPTRFSCMLFDLISKADEVNKNKISQGFQAHVLAYTLWCMAANNGHQLFDEYGLYSRTLSEK